MELFFDNVADPGSRVASDGDAKPPRVRRRGKFKGKRTGGGGVQRAFLSRWLKGKKMKGGLRKQVFQEGSCAFKDFVERGGPELARQQNIGRGMSASHAAAGKSLYSGKRKRNAQVPHAEAGGTSCASAVQKSDGEDLEGELALDIAALGCASR